MSSNKHFFGMRKPPAELKHGILRSYPPVLAGKTGKGGTDVVFLDGYAGPGVYEDGEPGSPLLLAKTAAGMSSRRIEGIFVERSPKYFRQLEATLRPYADSMPHRTFQADIGQVVDEILGLSRGKVLFAFLDPFGPAIRMDQIATILNRNGTSSRAWPPTELLLHFSASSVWRDARKAVVQSDQDALGRYDSFLGGTWWQDILADAHQESAGLAALEIGEQYAQMLSDRTGCMAIPMPVYSSLTARYPKYVLVLFTRHEEGIWSFAKVLGPAQRDWFDACQRYKISQTDQRQTKKGQEALFGAEEAYAFDEGAYNRQIDDDCVPIIRDNLRHLLQAGPVRIVDHTLAVYGYTLGFAWDKHVRAAVRKLHELALIDDDGRGKDFYRRTIRLARQS
ncbi:three-Cys-motif partner protein TcmP [Glycomyces sp. NPDC049804]|uniref:three-Cys-motif partner protein TcmP n=1 Tax=Glycomyces sp. NPDC049804 TaxID=3154363 RepID=UPI003438EDA8